MVQAKKYILSFMPSKIANLIDNAINDEEWSKLQEIRLCASGGL